MNRNTICAAVLTLTVATTTTVYGGITMPDAVFYGRIVIDCQLVTAQDDVKVIATVDGASEPVGTYKMGTRDLGDYYALRVRLESGADGSPHGDNAARVGDTVHIAVQQGDDPAQPFTDVVVEEIGDVQRVDLADEPGPDCNNNGIPDQCEPGGTEDCNDNSIPDLCDIYEGTSQDTNGDGVPDECEGICGGDEGCYDGDLCTSDECLDGMCQHTAIASRPYADVFRVPDGDGAVEDTLCILDAASGAGDCLTDVGGFMLGDIYPCWPPEGTGPDGAVEIMDTLSVLDAAKGEPGCSPWCP